MVFKQNIRENRPDMIIVESDFIQDFKMFNRIEYIRGVYYSETNKSWIYLSRHSLKEEIIDSCVHESIHGAIANELRENEITTDEISEDDEEEIIFYMLWADDFLYTDEEEPNMSFPEYNSALRIVEE